MVDTIFLQLFSEFSLGGTIKSNKQSSTSFSSQSFHKLEILHLMFDPDQIFVKWQRMDDEFDVLLLSLGQIVSMAQNTKACHIRGSMGFVFSDQLGRNHTQSAHLLLSSVISISQLLLSCILQYLLSLLLVSLQPLHRVNSKSGSQRFSQNQSVSRLSMVRHHILVLFNHCYCTSSHHRPGIIDCLTSSYLRFGLLSSISESMNHLGRCNVFFLFVHGG